MKKSRVKIILIILLSFFGLSCISDSASYKLKKEKMKKDLEYLEKLILKSQIDPNSNEEIKNILNKILIKSISLKRLSAKTNNRKDFSEIFIPYVIKRMLDIYKEGIKIWWKYASANNWSYFFTNGWSRSLDSNIKLFLLYVPEHKQIELQNYYFKIMSEVDREREIIEGEIEKEKKKSFNIRDVLE